jgi:PAS domain S-box-containing protein
MPIYNFIVYNHNFHFLLIAVLCAVAWMLYKRRAPQCEINDKMFREIAERSFDVIFLTDLTGHLTYVSPSAEKTFLRKDADALGNKIDAFIKEPGKHKVAELFAMVLKKGHMEGLELTIFRGDGSTLDMEVNASAIVRDGKSEGIQGVMRDITERKQIEKKLMERNEELEKINKLMIGREIKITELKEEMKDLKEKLSEVKQSNHNKNTFLKT